MGSIQEDRRLRGRRSVFNDRSDAGKALAMMLEGYRGKSVLVIAIPSGGLPVAAEVARCLDADLDIIAVRKLQTPRNPEAGFGAISLNGDTILNHGLVSDMELTDEQIERAKEKALREGRSREQALVYDRPKPHFSGKVVILVDDGLASGYTMLAAIRAVKIEHPSRVIVAVPTGSDRSVEMVAREVDEVVCLNIRGLPFAIADAYFNWYDIDEEEAARILRYGDRP